MGVTRRCCAGSIVASVVASTVVVAAGAIAVSGPAGASAGRGASGVHGARAGGLVGYPSFLPAKTLHYDGDAQLTGTARRPAVTSQGDPVRVRRAPLVGGRGGERT